MFADQTESNIVIIIALAIYCVTVSIIVFATGVSLKKRIHKYRSLDSYSQFKKKGYEKIDSRQFFTLASKKIANELSLHWLSWHHHSHTRLDWQAMP